VGGSRQVIIRTASKDASAGYWARLPPNSYVVSIIPLYSLKGKGWFTPPQRCGRRRIEPYQQLEWAVPPLRQGAQHHLYRRIATHPAGYALPEIAVEEELPAASVPPVASGRCTPGRFSSSAVVRISRRSVCCLATCVNPATARSTRRAGRRARLACRWLRSCGHL
jgi:hypothetical protein